MAELGCCCGGLECPLTGERTFSIENVFWEHDP